jgi:feruloyl esterase
MRCVHIKRGHKGCIRRRGHAKRRPLAPAIGLYRATSVLSTALLTLLVGIGATPAAAATCASLADLVLPDTTITAAQSVAAGTYTAPDGEVFTDLPAFCRIAATLTPTSDSNIKIEVWMPYSGWNGRYAGTGNGNIGGLIVYSSLAPGLQAGTAVANTDMGTSPAATQGGQVLTGHPEKQIDYATRSTHLMTVRSKQIIKAFYGEPPKYSYFLGCSTGGGQGIHEALQFPGDYDGILASAPEMNRTGHSAGLLWDYAAFNNSRAKITAAQATAVTSAVVKQCAGNDGGLASDNFLTDPRDCHWDPSALQCTGGSADAPTCLTAPQVAAVRKVYEGPINPRTGERIFAGQVPGSESNSGYPANNLSLPNSPYWAFGNDFDPLTFDFDHDMETLDDAMEARLNANTADLEEFKSHGGKVILWQGFADPRIPTLNTIAYYERLIASQTPGDGHGKGERKEGLRRTQEFAQFFLAPGVGHCGGGAGPDTADLISPLLQWVEQGIAPDQIIASKVVNGATVFSRPLCPYPVLPRYSGIGDPTQASSFKCVADKDHDDNQPPAPIYLDDRDNYPIVPITPIDDRDHDHDRGER